MLLVLAIIGAIYAIGVIASVVYYRRELFGKPSNPLVDPAVVRFYAAIAVLAWPVIEAAFACLKFDQWIRA